MIGMPEPVVAPETAPYKVSPIIFQEEGNSFTGFRSALFSIGQPEGFQQVLQSIELDFVDGGQQDTQLSLGKTLALEPLEIGYRQVAEYGALVPSKRHFHAHQLQQYIAIRLFWRLVHGDSFCWRHSKPIQILHSLANSTKTIRPSQGA